MSTDEERLRARLAELRAHDRTRAPAFERMWGAPRPRGAGVPWRAVVPAASLAAAAMMVLWCGAQTMTASAPQASAPAVAPAAAAGGEAPSAAVLDPAPLDFLLEWPSSAAASTKLDARTSNPIRGW